MGIASEASVAPAHTGPLGTGRSPLTGKATGAESGQRPARLGSARPQGLGLRTPRCILKLLTLYDLGEGFNTLCRPKK